MAELSHRQRGRPLPLFLFLPTPLSTLAGPAEPFLYPASQRAQPAGFFSSSTSRTKYTSYTVFILLHQSIPVRSIPVSSLIAADHGAPVSDAFASLHKHAYQVHSHIPKLY